MMKYLNVFSRQPEGCIKILTSKLFFPVQSVFGCISSRSIIHPQYCQKCFLRDFHAAYLLHAFLAGFLLFQQFFLA